MTTARFKCDLLKLFNSKCSIKRIYFFFCAIEMTKLDTDSESNEWTSVMIQGSIFAKLTSPNWPHLLYLKVHGTLAECPPWLTITLSL